MQISKFVVYFDHPAQSLIMRYGKARSWQVVLLSFQEHPRDIIFIIIKPPKFGRLLRSGASISRFSQEDINERKISYQPNSEILDEWSKRDWFQFTVTSNGTTKQPEQEYRFRISVTYAALPSHRLHEFVQIESIVVSPGKIYFSFFENEY